MREEPVTPSEPPVPAQPATGSADLPHLAGPADPTIASAAASGSAPTPGSVPAQPATSPGDPAPNAGSAPAPGSAPAGPSPAPGPAPGPAPAAPAPAPGSAPAGPASVPVSGSASTSAPVVFADEDGEPFDAEAYFDPDYGPPEGEEAWLAQVASPVADEYLAAHQPPAGVREVLAAGFTHRDHVPGARGWAAGGTLDTMEPGPALAGFADDAVTGGLSTLTDDELIGVLGSARRLASRAASVELAAVADLSARREADAAKTRDRRQAEHAADEIAAALTLTCRAADKLLGLAVNLARLPAVMNALAAGRIDLPKANVYALELAGLADDPAAAIAAVTIGDAAGLTTGELGAVLRRLVLAHDPDAARKKRQQAQKDARVETWAENAGTAALAGRDLPPADVLAADKNIDYYARQLKKAGTPGTLEFLRAKVFTALLTSRPLYTLLPGNDDCPGNDGSAGNPDGPRRRRGRPRRKPGRPCRRRGRPRRKPGRPCRRRGRPCRRRGRQPRRGGQREPGRARSRRRQCQPRRGRQPPWRR